MDSPSKNTNTSTENDLEVGMILEELLDNWHGYEPVTTRVSSQNQTSCPVPR